MPQASYNIDNYTSGVEYRMEHWPDPTGRLHWTEFDSPEHIDDAVIFALMATRQAVGPINCTRYKSRVLHPHGDAVPPDSTTHSPHSLHRYDYDHVGRKPASGFKCLAQDCDFSDQTNEALFETYLRIERLNIWTGIGVYPFWRNKGFHLDLRPRGHTAYGARWFRDQHGRYQPLTWANFKPVLTTYL